MPTSHSSFGSCASLNLNIRDDYRNENDTEASILPGAKHKTTKKSNQDIQDWLMRGEMFETQSTDDDDVQDIDTDIESVNYEEQLPYHTGPLFGGLTRSHRIFKLVHDGTQSTDDDDVKDIDIDMKLKNLEEQTANMEQRMLAISRPCEFGPQNTDDDVVRDIDTYTELMEVEEELGQLFANLRLLKKTNEDDFHDIDIDMKLKNLEKQAASQARMLAISRSCKLKNDNAILKSTPAPCAGKEIGGDGGTIEIGRCKIVIPEMALEATIPIQIELSMNPVVSDRGFVKITPTLKCLPTGTAFLKPVSIYLETWCVCDNEDVEALIFCKQDGASKPYVLSTTQWSNRTIIFQSSHFTEFEGTVSENDATKAKYVVNGIIAQKNTTFSVAHYVENKVDEEAAEKWARKYDYELKETLNPTSLKFGDLVQTNMASDKFCFKPESAYFQADQRFLKKVFKVRKVFNLQCTEAIDGEIMVCCVIRNGEIEEDPLEFQCTVKAAAEPFITAADAKKEATDQPGASVSRLPSSGQLDPQLDQNENDGAGAAALTSGTTDATRNARDHSEDSASQSPTTGPSDPKLDDKEKEGGSATGYTPSAVEMNRFLYTITDAISDTDWPRFARTELGLLEREIDNIQSDLRHSAEERKIKMLQLWRNKNVSTVTEPQEHLKELKDHFFRAYNITGNQVATNDAQPTMQHAGMLEHERQVENQHGSQRRTRSTHRRRKAFCCLPMCVW